MPVCYVPEVTQYVLSFSGSTFLSLTFGQVAFTGIHCHPKRSMSHAPLLHCVAAMMQTLRLHAVYIVSTKFPDHAKV